MTLAEAERLIKLGQELGLVSLTFEGLQVTYRATLTPLPANQGQTEAITKTGERMPTQTELLFAAVDGIDVEARPPSEDAA